MKHYISSNGEVIVQFDFPLLDDTPVAFKGTVPRVIMFNGLYTVKAFAVGDLVQVTLLNISRNLRYTLIHGSPDRIEEVYGKLRHSFNGNISIMQLKGKLK